MVMSEPDDPLGRRPKRFSRRKRRVPFEPGVGRIYLLPPPPPKRLHKRRAAKLRRAHGPEREIVATTAIRSRSTLSTIGILDGWSPADTDVARAEAIRRTHEALSTLIGAPGVRRAQVRWMDGSAVVVAQAQASDPIRMAAALRALGLKDPNPALLQQWGQATPAMPRTSDWELVQVSENAPFVAGFGVVLSRRDPLLSACQRWQTLLEVVPRTTPTICLADLLSASESKVGVYGLVEGETGDEAAATLFGVRQVLAAKGLLAVPVTAPQQTLWLLDPARPIK